MSLRTVTHTHSPRHFSCTFPGLKLDEASRERLRVTEAELLEEKELALQVGRLVGWWVGGGWLVVGLVLVVGSHQHFCSLVIGEAEAVLMVPGLA